MVDHPDKFTLQKNAFKQRNYSGFADYFLHFVDFLEGGVYPPPIIADMSAKKFLLTPSLSFPKLLFNF